MAPPGTEAEARDSASYSLTGGLYNFDADEPEALVCPVPYFRDTNNLKPITVRVVVEDLHHQLGIISPSCVAATRPGSKICDSGNNFPDRRSVPRRLS